MDADAFVTLLDTHFRKDPAAVVRLRKRQSMAARSGYQRPPSYQAAHDQLRRCRGLATAHSCVDCGGKARQWSLNHKRSANVVQRDFPESSPFSMDVDHYDPRCVRCHVTYDTGNWQTHLNTEATLATITVTHTSVYNTIDFADPYKQCVRCGGWITGVLDSPGPMIVVPCEHRSDYRDLCPSWSPVDGCRCVEHLGSVDHPVPPASVLAGRTA